MARKNLWFNYERIHKFVAITPQELVQVLCTYYDMRGGRMRVMFQDGKYFLNPAYMGEFVQKFNLMAMRDVPMQDGNWVTTLQLTRFFHVLGGDAINALRMHKNDADMRTETGEPLIQFRRTGHGRHVSLCLLRSQDAFVKLANKMGWVYNDKKRVYKLRNDWTDKSEFSDAEIHKAIMSLLDKNYIYTSEYACMDALLSELPKERRYVMRVRKKAVPRVRKQKSR